LTIDYENRRRQELDHEREREELYRMERLRHNQRAEDEEAERLRLIKIANVEAERLIAEKTAIEEVKRLRLQNLYSGEEANRLRNKSQELSEQEMLLKRLREIEDEEAERKAKLRKAEQEVDRFRRVGADRSHMTEQESQFGELDLMGISEDELDQQCDELFADTPIEFKPRRNVEIDQIIAQLISDIEITIPIVWIKQNQYLIGSTIFSLEIRKDQLQMKVGTAWENFENHVAKNHRFFQRNLVIQMIKSGESLEWVVDNLMNGKKIKSANDENYGLAANYSRRAPQSPKRTSRTEAVKKTTTTTTRISRVGDISKNSSGIRL